jgi:hypothetical protein
MRKRIGRLYYVGSKRSRVLHLSHSIVECSRTLCGVMIGHGTWKWARSLQAQKNAKRASLCSKCLKVAPQIIVARVRR